MNISEGNQHLKLPRWISPPTVRKRETILTVLVCLIISTILWFFNELSKNYTTTISHPVEYVDLPKNKFIINTPPHLLNLKVNAFGFTLIRYKLTMSFSPLLLDVNEILESQPPVSAGVYIISTRNITEQISSQISSGMELMDITPGIFTLAFDSLDVKRVPVGSKVGFSFKPRFGLISPVRFEPSFVTITGPHDLVKSTDTIYTVPRFFKNLDVTLSQKIPLIIPRQIYIEPAEVNLIAAVDEFTERNMFIPIWIDNQSDNYKIRLFPHDVEVSFRIGLSEYTQIKPEDFSLYVSWEDIQKNLQVLKVRIKKSPAGVKNLKIIPEHVEYLIEKN